MLRICTTRTRQQDFRALRRLDSIWLATESKLQKFKKERIADWFSLRISQAVVSERSSRGQLRRERECKLLSTSGCSVHTGVFFWGYTLALRKKLMALLSFFHIASKLAGVNWRGVVAEENQRIWESERGKQANVKNSRHRERDRMWKRYRERCRGRPERDRMWKWYRERKNGIEREMGRQRDFTWEDSEDRKIEKVSHMYSIARGTTQKHM